MTTLTEIREELEKSNKSLEQIENTFHKDLLWAHTLQNSQIDVLHQILGVLSDSLKLEQDRDREEGRKLSRMDDDDGEKEPKVVKTKDKEDPLDLKGLWGAIGGILGGLVGFTVGFVAEVVKVYKAVGFTLISLSKKIYQVVEGFVMFFYRIFRFLAEETGLTKVFTSIQNAIKGLVAEGSFLSKMGELIARDIRLVGETIKDISRLIKSNFVLFGEYVKSFFGEGSQFRKLFAEGSQFRKILAPVESAIATMRSWMSSVVSFFRRFQIALGYGEVQKALMAMEKGATTVARTGEAIGETAGIFTRISTSITESFSTLTNAAKRIGGTLGESKGVLGKAVTAAKNLFGGVKSMFAFLEPIGRIFGKLFVPLLVIYETVTNFFKAFTDESNEAKSFGEKFLDGLKGTLVGIIDELLFVPLDLVKDLISWTAGKLGFENFEKALDSFSFEKLFHGLVDNFWQIFEDIGFWLEDQFDSFMDDPLKYLGNLANSLAETISNAMTGIFGAIKNALIGVLNLIPGVNIGKTDEEVKQEEEEKEKAKAAKAEKKEARKREKLEREEKKALQNELKSKGVVKSAGFLQGYKIDDDLLADMSEEELERVAQGFSADKNIQLQVDKELDRRAEALAPVATTENQTEKLGTPTMTQVVNPAPSEPLVLQSNVNTSERITTVPEIVSTGQEAASLSQEMTDYQRILNDNRNTVTNNNNRGGTANVGVDASNTTINNNTTIRSAGMASAFDITDRKSYSGVGIPYRR